MVGPRIGPGCLVDLGAAAAEISALRWTLGQVVALAQDAPGLTDQQLWARLVALAQLARPRTG